MGKLIQTCQHVEVSLFICWPVRCSRFTSVVFNLSFFYSVISRVMDDFIWELQQHMNSTCSANSACNKPWNVCVRLKTNMIKLLHSSQTLLPCWRMTLKEIEGSCAEHPALTPGGLALNEKHTFIRRHRLCITCVSAGKCIQTGKQAAGGVWPAHQHRTAAETDNNHQDKGRKGTRHRLFCLFFIMLRCCLHSLSHCIITI